MHYVEYKEKSKKKEKGMHNDKTESKVRGKKNILNTPRLKVSVGYCKVHRKGVKLCCKSSGHLIAC